MERNTIEFVLECIEAEGFCNAFIAYSDFKDVKDEEFHKRRKAFVESAHFLAEYLGSDELG